MKEYLKKVTSSAQGIAALVIVIVCINLMASKLFHRLDVSQDSVYSISQGSKKILSKLDDNIAVKFYFSRSNKNLPPFFKVYATRVEEVLNEYARYSKGKLSVEIIDPKPDTDEEEWARKYNLSKIPLQAGEDIYFGAVFLYGAKEIAIPFFDPRKEEFLEYDISESIVQAFNKEHPKAGVLSSLPIMGMPANPYMNQGGGAEPWAFIEELRKSFDLQTIEQNSDKIDSSLRFLIIFHPKNLSDQLLYAIDQYLLQGGRLIVAVDPMSRVDLAMQGQFMNSGQMPKADSNLEKLFRAWDIEYNPSQMVGDLNYMTKINAGGMVIDYPFFLSLPKAAIEGKSVITGNLNYLLFAEAGNISLKKDSSYKFEPLIQTTKDSGPAPAAMAAFMSPLDLSKEMKIDNTPKTLAAMLTGKFKTAFPEGKPKKPDDKNKDAAPQSSLNEPFLTEAAAETSILIIADTDFLADHNAVDKFSLGRQSLIKLRNDNLPFIANAADFFGGSQDLISIRSRGKIARPFTRVAEIQKNAQLKWQSEEEKLSQRLSDLEKKLSELQSSRSEGSRFFLSSAQQAEINKFRAEEKDVRQRRREVRKNLREDIESLGNQLTAANLLVMPLAVLGFGVWVFYQRNNLRRKGIAEKSKKENKNEK